MRSGIRSLQPISYLSAHFRPFLLIRIQFDTFQFSPRHFSSVRHISVQFDTCQFNSTHLNSSQLTKAVISLQPNLAVRIARRRETHTGACQEISFSVGHHTIAIVQHFSSHSRFQLPYPLAAARIGPCPA